MRPRVFNLLVPVGFLLASWATCHAEDPRSTAEQVRFFETRIRPLLADRCFSCHGPDNQRSDLRLDTAEGIRRGGASDASLIDPGRPEASLLLRAVRHEGDAPKMPPKGKLSDSEITDLTIWVKVGTPFPIRVTTEEGGDRHWAFQPPPRPVVPEVRDTSWAQTPLDRFILAALEAKGLRPAPPADPRTLIRRVTFDLTGLPPTPEEVDRFLADRSPDAFVRVVDRLVASPAYGERWGRHWLDVARYADSNGLDENVAHGNAWRYRDHVVAAFNRDQPYDQFLTEQLAGDLMPTSDTSTRHRRLIATGFLSLGPKVLAEPDPRKMELDIVDEQVDTVGRAFLGLTIGCARCHDHKFDPLSTEDYYGLAGIFLSTRTMESFCKVARWHENPLPSPEDAARKAEHEARVAGVRQAIKALSGRMESQTGAELKQRKAELAQMEESGPNVATAMGVTEADVVDASVMRRGNHLTPGKVVPRRFPVAFAGETQPTLPPKSSGRLELAQWLIAKDHPLTARVMVNRIWRWHFGQGLVRSVDNFGRLGKKPSHPELLDWLAHSFVESGWSIKAMHRLILVSSAYQMSSANDAGSARIDPDNRLLWRMNVRRLEAEAIRDNLLAVSGTLDRTMGGSLLHVANRGYLFDHTSKDATQYDRPRRSIYLPVIRNNLYAVYQLFDATDATVSSGDRATTTVATQALFAMNSELVMQASERLAARLLARADLDDWGRTRLLYEIAYGRSPTARELQRARAAFAGFEENLRPRQPNAGTRRLQAWACFCQVILAANEFVYAS
jgi:hypothetical protein